MNSLGQILLYEVIAIIVCKPIIAVLANYGAKMLNKISKNI